MASLKELLEKRKQEQDAAKLKAVGAAVTAAAASKTTPVEQPKTEQQTAPIVNRFSRFGKPPAAPSATPAQVNEAPKPLTEPPKPTPVLPKAAEIPATVVAQADADKVLLTDVRKNLDYLAANIEQKELVGQVVRTIAVQLAQNKQLAPFITDADVDLLVRGLRRSHIVQARKVDEKKDKKEKKSVEFNEMMDMMKNMGINLS